MAKKTTVLIVDDSRFMRDRLKDILQDNGYDVVGEATNGYEAIEAFASNKPDIVTMDITMPDLDGIEALKKIVELDPEAKVVMCSAIGGQGKVIEAIKLGACDFIVKPFHPERVTQVLAKICKHLTVSQ